MKGVLADEGSWKVLLYFITKPESPPQPPHGCLHLLVLRGVDQGFNRGDDSERSPRKRPYRWGGQRAGRRGQGHEVKGDHCDVGGARSGDGFPPALPA